MGPGAVGVCQRLRHISDDLFGGSGELLGHLGEAESLRFSFWMTSMLHRFTEATDFDLRRQIAELELVTSSPSAAKNLADNYTGLPFE
jgi:p-hydroxybenzoate 3-monooxygenase